MNTFVCGQTGASNDNLVSLNGWPGWVVVELAAGLHSGDRVEVYECLPSESLDPEQLSTPDAEQESYDVYVGNSSVLVDGVPDPDSEGWQICGANMRGIEGCEFTEP